MLVGAFRVSPFVTALAALGVILAAVYLLWMVQRVAFGAAGPSAATLPDLTWREAVTLVPLAGLVFWIGVYPEPVLSVMHSSVAHLIQQVGPGQGPEIDLVVNAVAGGR